MAISVNKQSNTSNLLEQLTLQRQAQQEKLASAQRINRAADDAAGLQIADRLTSQLNEQNQAVVNVQDNINVNNIQSSKLSAITDSLQRANELSVQSGNPLADSSAIQTELNQLNGQINTLAKDALGQDNFVTALDANDPATTQAAIESAYGSVEAAATAIGAEINTQTSQRNTFTTNSINTASSRSRIQDTDFAKVTSEQEQNNVLLRSAILTKKDDETRKGLLLNKIV